jgi:hypothetical protein
MSSYFTTFCFFLLSKALGVSINTTLSGLKLLIDASVSLTSFSSLATDLSGNKNHGTFRNQDGVATGIGYMDSNLKWDFSDITPCMNFVGMGDATQGYLQWATHPLAGATKYTIEGWIKLPLAQVAAYNMLFYGSATSSFANELGFAMQAESGGILGVEINNVWTGTSSGYVTPVDQWLHVVMVYDGTATVRVYVDGALVYSPGGFPVNSALPSGAWNWIGIGQYDNRGYNGAFGYTQMKIAYLALYASGLSAADVATAYLANRARFGKGCPPGYSVSGNGCSGHLSINWLQSRISCLASLLLC